MTELRKYHLSTPLPHKLLSAVNPHKNMLPAIRKLNSQVRTEPFTRGSKAISAEETLQNLTDNPWRCILAVKSKMRNSNSDGLQKHC